MKNRAAILTLLVFFSSQFPVAFAGPKTTKKLKNSKELESLFGVTEEPEVVPSEITPDKQKPTQCTVNPANSSSRELDKIEKEVRDENIRQYQENKTIGSSTQTKITKNKMLLYTHRGLKSEATEKILSAGYDKILNDVLESSRLTKKKRTNGITEFVESFYDQNDLFLVPNEWTPPQLKKPQYQLIDSKNFADPKTKKAR